MNQVAEKSDNQEPVRVVEIGVKGLFGLYDHTVKLKDERITIIHGPNGVGKTVFLRLINLVLHSKFVELVSFNFSEFYVLLSNRYKLCIFKENKDTTSVFSLMIAYDDDSIFTTNTSGFFDFNKINPDQISKLNFELKTELINNISRVKTDAKIFANYPFDIQPLYQTTALTSQQWLELWFVIIKNLFPIFESLKVWFISVDRLVWDGSNKPTIYVCAEDLAHVIGKALADYGKNSNKLEQSFPSRLIDAIDSYTSIENIASTFKEINIQRNRYHNINLLDLSKEVESFDIKRLEDLSILKLATMELYASDTKEKLNTLDLIARKIETFLILINSKFKNKRVIIDQKNGFCIRDLYGNNLDLASLSTGEQHLCILLYELIFGADPEQLVLIDEPELSMHISWQRDFVDDLLKIIELNPIDVILATHSPSIINDHSNLMVAFKADVQQEAA